MKHTYKITGMTCENCENKITRVLENIPEITKVEINREKGIADITMNIHVQTSNLQESINSLGDYIITMDTEISMNQKPEKKNLIKDLTPLFAIVGFIILLTTIVTVLKDENIIYWMRLFMAHFLIFFGILKLIKLKDFASAYAEYDIIAQRSKLYAYAYPFIELGLGILLMVHIFPIVIFSLVAFVMFIGAIGVFIKLMKKEEIPCACLGTVFKVPMTWVTLVEDLVMVAMAIIMIICFYNL